MQIVLISVFPAICLQYKRSLLPEDANAFLQGKYFGSECGHWVECNAGLEANGTNCPLSLLEPAPLVTSK